MDFEQFSAVRLFHDFGRVSTIAKWQRVAEEWLFGQNWAKLSRIWRSELLLG